MLIPVFAISLLFLTTQALAYPAPGDRAVYEGRIRLPNGTHESLLVTKEVMRFDDRKKEWMVRVEQNRDGKIQREIEKESSLFTPEKFRSILSTCTSRGGRIETITVRAGTFSTCRLVTDPGPLDRRETWFGDLPFGIVKKITVKTEGTQTIELSSLKIGT